MGSSPALERRPVRHPLFARFFDSTAARRDDREYRCLRRRLLAGLRGQVIEVGAGSGLTFPHYPSSVTELIAVEPEPYLRSRAEVAASVAAIEIKVIDGLADCLPIEDGYADATVACGVLCSVPDVPAALAEVRRVLRPRGELRFLEHVRATGPIRARYQDLASVIWPRLMGGCHPNRDTRVAIEEAGFQIESVGYFLHPRKATPSVLGPRILGAARLPGQLDRWPNE